MIQNLENEIWITHPIFTDYAASNLGRIKSLERDVYKEDGTFHQHRQEKLIKQSPNKDGYLKFKISKDSKIIAHPLVHRFVYEAFHKCIIPDDLEVNHIDCNRSNNQIFNLELLDHQSNIDYSVSKTVGQYDLNGNLIKIWKSTMEAGRNGFNQGNISDCCRNCYTPKSPNIYKGFKWQYIDE